MGQGNGVFEKNAIARTGGHGAWERQKMGNILTYGLKTVIIYTQMRE